MAVRRAKREREDCAQLATVVTVIVSVMHDASVMQMKTIILVTKSKFRQIFQVLYIRDGEGKTVQKTRQKASIQDLSLLALLENKYACRTLKTMSRLLINKTLQMEKLMKMLYFNKVKFPVLSSGKVYETDDSS